jgi:predicted nucleic acid-binding Zn ribbon protein
VFCQYCGKKIDEFADVCIGCGKLLKQEKKGNTQSKLFMALSIIILVFSSIFLVVGVVSFFIGADNGYLDLDILNGADIRPNTLSMYSQTYFLLSLVASLIFEACAAILSLILLMFNSKKVINIVSLGISMGTLVIVGILAFVVGV